MTLAQSESQPGVVKITDQNNNVICETPTEKTDIVNVMHVYSRN